MKLIVFIYIMQRQHMDEGDFDPLIKRIPKYTLRLKLI